MSNAIVHIGLGRCGSTYIQRLFSELDKQYTYFTYIAPSRSEIESLEYSYLKDSSRFKVHFLDHLFSPEFDGTLLVASEFFSCKPLALYALVKRLSSLVDNVTVSLIYRPESELATSFFFKFFLHIDLTYYYLESFLDEHKVKFAIFNKVSADLIFRIFCIVDRFRFFSSVVPGQIPVPRLEEDFFLHWPRIGLTQVNLVSLPLNSSRSHSGESLFIRYINAIGLNIDTSFRPDMDGAHNESMGPVQSHQCFLDLYPLMGLDSRQYLREIKKRRSKHHESVHSSSSFIPALLEKMVSLIYSLYFREVALQEHGWRHRFFCLILQAVRTVVLRITLKVIRYISLIA